MSEISIWPLRKSWLSTCWQSQRSDVSCSWPPGLHTSQEGFWHTPLQILSKSLRFRGWRLATRTFSSLHRFSMWLRSGDWLGHSRTLMCFFLSHTFVALSCVLGHCHAGIPIHDPFSMPWPWRYMTPSIIPLMQSSCPVPLAEKHLYSIMFPPPCLTVGMVFLGSYAAFLLQTWQVESMPKSSNMISSDHNTFTTRSPLNHWQTSDGPVHVLSWARGPCRRCRIAVLHGVVCYRLFSTVCDYCLSCLEIIDTILLCSSGLIPPRSRDHWNSTRWDLARSPRLREIWQLFYVFSICQ